MFYGKMSLFKSRRFSWDWYCELTGEKIGDDSHKTKVENLCDTEYGTRYENCPTYQHR